MDAMVHRSLLLHVGRAMYYRVVPVVLIDGCAASYSCARNPFAVVYG